MSSFDDLLQDWRDREEHESAMLLLADTELLVFCALWRAAMLQRVDSYPLGTSWSDLWDCVTVNYQLLADMADSTPERTRFQVRRLRELRLVYPDGTRTAMATKAVMKFMFDRLS
ncbi:hypothetical protein [Rhodoferax sp.]|uniref:hypothetical protein n=1 Tax=Rhodoferax sp. TaxID=50421 RepID=UPI002751BBBE|nr:hypothetical protein [Rhodoferax sp.]